MNNKQIGRKDLEKFRESLNQISETVNESLEQLGRMANDFFEKIKTEYPNQIRHNDKIYNKVDRDAVTGDMVVFTHIETTSRRHQYTQLGKYYEVVDYMVYVDDIGRTNSVNGWLEGTEWIVYEEVKEKSANEQRAEIIEKAKRCVKEWLTPNTINEWKARGIIKGFVGQRANCGIPYLTVNSEKRTAHFVARGVKSNSVLIKTKATCHPNDVFNEHIGKAIALGRALGKDVSDFENAVQPTVAVGQVVEVLGRDDKPSNDGDWSRVVIGIDDQGYPEFGGGKYATNYKITDDTNARYGGIE